jgi:ATP-dependent Lhr-like helicase
MDEADAGRIHTVIAGGIGSVVVDMRTGKPAIKDADESTAGGAIFHAGSLRRLMSGPDGEAYLGGAVARGHHLARIKGTGPALPVSRTIVWALARRNGFDPTRWILNDNGVVTWGGETLNTLLAALLARAAPKAHFVPTMVGVDGRIPDLYASIIAIRLLAEQAQSADGMPIDIASKFTNTSRYIGELSPSLAAREKRRSIPWEMFFRRIDQIAAVEIDACAKDTLPRDSNLL